jgi:hypothetical protein
VLCVPATATRRYAASIELLQRFVASRTDAASELGAVRLACGHVRCAASTRRAIRAVDVPRTPGLARTPSVVPGTVTGGRPHDCTLPSRCQVDAELPAAALAECSALVADAISGRLPARPTAYFDAQVLLFERGLFSFTARATDSALRQASKAPSCESITE